MGNDKFYGILKGETESRIFPFFWQHEDSDEDILRELHKIHESHVRSVCIESRPHKGFVTESWWDDLRLIFNECRKLGMDAWILDDKYFPTGYCNGAIPAKYPELCKRAVTEKHMDLVGPVKDASVIFEGWAEEDREDKLLAIIASEMVNDRTQTLCDNNIDLTDCLKDGLVSVDLPEGMWRIFFIFERPVRDGRVDFTNPESSDKMFSEIYEPHYENLSEYFGNTFKGFFSDEPFIMDNANLPLEGKSNSKGKYPWNRYIESGMKEKYPENWKLLLPTLWFSSKGNSKAFRIAYMDTVTCLYRDSFGNKVGKWCRDHGIMYVGHIVEDYGQHLNMSSGGHYFRALEGQDMAGVDVVLHQIVPGMENYQNACNCWYDVADPDFFTFSLAKLASSHAHIQKSKEGRAMCEIFGAYGWAEGLKMMKWLADHMLVRGINYFVPHAFSSLFPDEVPPQFTGNGHNPQYEGFRYLMDYMSRISTLLSGGDHHVDTAILYHAEAEWSGGAFTPFYPAARVLTASQVDFDIIPSDYLKDALTDSGEFFVGNGRYRCLVVMNSEFTTKDIAEILERLGDAGVVIIFAGGKPSFVADTMEPYNSPKGSIEISIGELPGYIKKEIYDDIKTDGSFPSLRSYHYIHDGSDIYMFTNEGIRKEDSIDTYVTLGAWDKYCCKDAVIYFPMENKAYRIPSDNGKVRVRLQPYESVIFILGEKNENLEEFAGYPGRTSSEILLDGEYSLKLYNCENYEKKKIASLKLSELVNICSPEMYPKFGGYMEYETYFDFDSEISGRVFLDLGGVGENAYVSLNGKEERYIMCPPYRLEITDDLVKGRNSLRVTVTNTLAYEERDLCSKYLLLEPSGLLGPVKLIVE